MNVRWQYRFGDTPEEATQRAALQRGIDAWWTAFSDRRHDLSSYFRKQSSWDVPGWMDEMLGAIDPALMWEFGPAVQTQGHRLVVTPEGNRALRPLVQHLLDAAPKLEGWEFYGHRLPESVDVARAIAERRCDRPCRLTEVVVSLTDTHLIHLTYSGLEAETTDPELENEAHFLTQALLGEELLNGWVGEISAQERPKRGFLKLGKRQAVPEAVTLDQLKQHFEQTIQILRTSLPGPPSEDAPWSHVEVEPFQAEDCTAQDDVYSAQTKHLGAWRAQRELNFCDRRFAGDGGTFCYVKLDGSPGLDAETLADIGELQTAVEASVKPHGWGYCIGRGMGTKYSYVDLVLTDCANAIPAIRRRLIEGNVPKRSWILFHDCELAGEWVGIYDDTPPPP